MRKIPCPCCRGKIILQEGTMVDVGIGMVQVEDDLRCQFCDETGMIELGGAKHNEWRKNAMNKGKYKPRNLTPSKTNLKSKSGGIK